MPFKGDTNKLHKVKVGQLWRGNFFGCDNGLFLVLGDEPITKSGVLRWKLLDLTGNIQVLERESCFNDYYLWVSDG